MAVPANAQTVGDAAGARGDFSRLLGAGPQAPSRAAEVPAALSSRFRLTGVLAPRPYGDGAKPSSSGVALIAVDGKPPRAYPVGARIDADLVLLSVARRSASIGPAQGEPLLVLELPPPPAPASGTLPRLVQEAPMAQPMARPMAPPPQGVAPPDQPQMSMMPPPGQPPDGPTPGMR